MATVWRLKKDRKEQLVQLLHLTGLISYSPRTIKPWYCLFYPCKCKKQPRVLGCIVLHSVQSLLFIVEKADDWRRSNETKRASKKASDWCRHRSARQPACASLASSGGS